MKYAQKLINSSQEEKLFFFSHLPMLASDLRIILAKQILHLPPAMNHAFQLTRDISGPEYRWALKMDQRPISHSFTYKMKNQDFDGPFCIFMGLLEKMMGQRILNRHLTAKLTSNSNSLCMGPNQKLKQI